MLESVARVTAACAVGLYALGLIAVNTYLAPFGVTEFSLFKPQYAYAGVLLLLLPVVALLVLVEACSVVQCLRTRHANKTEQKNQQQKKPRRNWSRWNTEFGGIALCALFMWIAIAVFRSTVASRTAPQAMSDAWKMDSWLVAMDAVVYFGWRCFAQRPAIRAPDAAGEDPSTQIDTDGGSGTKGPNRVCPVICTLVALLLFSQYLGRFDDDVLPTIGRQLGGARPYSAVLALTPDGAHQAPMLGLQVTTGDLTSVAIVFEGSDFYLICVPPGPQPDASRCITSRTFTAVRLDKSLVMGSSITAHGR